MARRGASGSNMTSRILSSEELRPLAMFNDRHVTYFCYGAHQLEWKLSDCSDMGNSESSVEEHVEQARKTGVCSLKERKLSQVRPKMRKSS